MNSVLRINLLPWRAARQQKLQKQWLLAAGLIVLVCMSVLVVRLLYVWQQSQLVSRDLQMAAAQHTTLSARLQQLQIEVANIDDTLSPLWRVMNNFRQHSMWQVLAEYPEAFVSDAQGLQLSLISASAARWQLSGVSSDAQSVSDFLSGRSELQLSELQLRADGRYEFSTVHFLPEARP